MSHASTDPAKPAPRQVGIDTLVQLELLNAEGDGEALTCQIVRAEASDLDAGLLGEDAPLAGAIRGKWAGERVAYIMGDIVAVHIVAVQPAAAPAAADAATRRQAVLDEARRKAEQTNAEMFAASYGSKWGGYDSD